MLLLPWACDDPRTSHLARQCIDAIATPSGAAQRGRLGGTEHRRLRPAPAPGRFQARRWPRADQAMCRVKRAGKRGFAQPSGQPAGSGAGLERASAAGPASAPRQYPACLAALPAPQQASARAAIQQPAVVEHPQYGRDGVMGWRPPRGTGSAARRVGGRQAMKSETTQHIGGLGKRRLLQLGQGLLQTGTDQCRRWKLALEESAPLLQPGLGGDLEGPPPR